MFGAVPDVRSVLVVEDDAALARAIRDGLVAQGMATETAGSAEEAGALLEARRFHCIVLDLGLPGVDGVALLRALRHDEDATPVLILTARGTLEDRVAGLDAGADDYLPKPFALAELLARLRALLRRVTTESTDVLRFADLELDPGTREVGRGGRPIELTRTEFSLLELFLRNPRQVLTRSVIFERVWGFDFGPTSNSLDVYIGYLRRKTEDGGAPRLIHTVRGVGYALRDP